MALSFGLVAVPAFSQVTLNTLDVASTQSFDTLPSSGSAIWVNNTTIPGWYHARTGNGTTIVADTGSGTGGNLYSYGTGTASDRALGSLGSSNVAAGNFFWGVRLQNDTGTTITSLDVSYTGEQWRNSAAAAQVVVFSYLLGSPTVTGSLSEFQSAGVAVTSLNFTSPITGAPAGALNGNAAVSQQARTATISGLNIANGAEIMLRWSDPDHSGVDHGLSIDDVSITPRGVPLTGLSVSDVEIDEGNSGTTSFDFVVSLDSPAPVGGVTFDIATMDGSAIAPSDYTARALTGQTIPAGSQNYTFSVLVNGDTTFENDESFTVKVSNVIGVPVVDGEGLGTVLNDDAGALLNISDATNNEGNSGTTPFQFTVSLSQPAPVGGVTFDIATSNGTAMEPGDYSVNSQVGAIIPAGQTFMNFNVLVNGDTAPEPDETFNVTVSNVTNALIGDGAGLGTILNDDVVKIHDVQGSGAGTPIAPSVVVAVEGVVTASFQGANQFSGFFLQEEDADIDSEPLTSEGIFVFCSTCPTTVVEGQRVRVNGTVAEFFGMTQIVATTPASITVTNAGNNLADITPATITLPVLGLIDDYYEPREGMLVTYTNPLSVSEYFELPRYGQIELYQGGRPRQFTETTAPNAAGYAAHLAGLAARRVVLDDENNTQNSLLNLVDGMQFAYYPRQNGGFSLGTQGMDYFRGGDIVNNLTGVLHWSFAGITGTDAWRIRPTLATPPVFTPVNTRPLTPPAVGGSIRAVGMNLLNYFTTIDTTPSSSTGPCGPTMTQDCRGADSVAELDRQRERAANVFCALNPDVAGLMELENTTATDSINDLLAAVNAQCGTVNPYYFSGTGSTLGGDAIRVQIVYRSGVVVAVGSPMVDLDPINSRPTTAQTFDVVDPANGAFGERFTLVANHLKSKGGCGSATGGDVDNNDGQGCFAARRTAQATRLLTWLNSTVIPTAGDPDVLLVGDFNSYAQEPPITTLTGAGYTDLETSLLGSAAYSYLFDGQLGHLDYALASGSLVSKVTGVTAWHINADESALFDYNDDIRDVGEATNEEKPDGSALMPPRSLYQPGSAFRASDHDPVLVGMFDTDRIFRNGFDSTP
ncbi:MAG: ExeM/NucH family extracellular endonuclease [Dokdonella sp.]